MAGLQTEFEFTLPRGYVDSAGNLHKDGVMRLATAIDEIAPLRDMRVQGNQAYLVIVLLARVISRLGSLTEVNAGVIEKMFSSDLSYLQDFYRRINESGETRIPATCPSCGTHFDVELGPPGGIGYPLEQLHEEVAFIAYYFHWPLEDVLELEHGDRRRWVEQISGINRKLREEAEQQWNELR